MSYKRVKSYVSILKEEIVGEDKKIVEEKWSWIGSDERVIRFLSCKKRLEREVFYRLF